MTETATAGRLADRVAIVTGGAGGIGRAVCSAFAAAGARVVMVDLPGPALDDAWQTLVAVSGRPADALGMALGLDVTSEADMTRMAQATVERFGRIDILVASAGILRAPGTPPKPVADTAVNEWQVVLDVNLTGVFLSNRAVIPTLMTQREGLIINLSSTSGRQGRAHDGPYCATKFGVAGLSEALAEELRPRGIKVQAVFPDAVETPLWEQNGPIKPEHALPPERVADLILYMATLPADTLLVGPALAPFRTRRRRRRDGAVQAGAGQTTP